MLEFNLMILLKFIESMGQTPLISDNFQTFDLRLALSVLLTNRGTDHN